ncbi:MAG: SDR family oxidoreductase [Bacteroidetes bacterium]|nr:MAG: SDR family oxidoreductase [Bacteroidota bacterium]
MTLEELTRHYDFHGKTVVLTGGTGVLGGEMACALAGCHANVVILDRSERLAGRGLQCAGERNGQPGVLCSVYGDVLRRDTLEQANEQILAEFGEIYGLINAAGGNRSGATTGPDLSFFDLPEEALRFVFDLNVVGTILPTQIFGRSIARAGEGAIINVSSMNAFRPLTRIPAYSAAKAGINNFTQWLAVHIAQEYSPRVRVNAIAPGFFLTKQNEFLLTDEATGDLTERGQTIIAHTPMGRFGDPADLLGTLLWLLSPLSAFVTGVVVPVDGGFSAFSGV